MTIDFWIAYGPTDTPKHSLLNHIVFKHDFLTPPTPTSNEFIPLHWIPDHFIVLLLLLLLSRFSHVWLCATPKTAAHHAPPSLGFSRQEHWSGLLFPSPMHESEKWKWNRSVVSRPHGLQPTRLLRPWDSPGKSTRVGGHHLLLVHHR